MKRISVLFFLFLFILTACGGVSDEEAAKLFVDRLVYQKNAGEFARSFRYGKVAGEELDENRLAFEENFVNNLSATGVNVSPEQAETLTNNLLKQVQEKTSYKIIKIEKKEKEVVITYYVTGLDLVNTMQEIARDLIKEAQKNPAIAEDEQTTLDTTIELLEEKIQNIKIKSDPVKMSMHLTKTKGKWEVPEKRKNEVMNLFMAFVSGEKNQNVLSEEVEEALSRVIKEVLEEGEAQPLNKK